MGGEPQGSLLAPVAFSTFINNMEKVMESSIIRLARDTKLWEAVITVTPRGTWTGRRNEQTGKAAALWKRSWVSFLTKR